MKPPSSCQTTSHPKKPNSWKNSAHTSKKVEFLPLDHMFHIHAGSFRKHLVRPVSIVSRQHFVNLARSRALAFGTRELVGPSAHNHPGAAPSLARQDSKSDQREDLIVTTSAPVASQHDGKEQEVEWDALEKRPRGFFADQFEASICTFWKDREYADVSWDAFRTSPMLKRIIKVLDRRFGSRRMAA